MLIKASSSSILAPSSFTIAAVKLPKNLSSIFDEKFNSDSPIEKPLLPLSPSSPIANPAISDSAAEKLLYLPFKITPIEGLN